MTARNIAEQWFQKAFWDLDAAIALFERKNFTNVCFHCQQAAEKSLKGYLVHKGIEPPRVHQLEELCQLCMAYDKTFLQLYGPGLSLNPYAVQFRYPSDEPDVSSEEAQTALENAQTIYDFCKAKIGDNLN